MLIHGYGVPKRSVDRMAPAVDGSAHISLSLAGDRRTGETSVLLPPPDVLRQAEDDWVLLRRFKGIVFYLMMPKPQTEGAGGVVSSVSSSAATCVPKGDWPITVVFAGYAARKPSATTHHGGCTLWISTEQARTGNFPSYGATMHECLGRELRPTQFGNAQAAQFRQLFTERPWISSAGAVKTGRVFGDPFLEVLLDHVKAPKDKPAVAHSQVQEVPPNLLFIRHIERFVAGLTTLTTGKVHLVGASAGTHSAVALAVLAKGESGAWKDFDIESWSPASVLLAALAAPSPYIQALADLKGLTVTIVQSQFDELCPVDMDALRGFAQEVNARKDEEGDEGRWSVLAVEPPTPCLARAVLGLSGHGYTRLANDKQIRSTAASGGKVVNEKIVLKWHQQEAASPGIVLAAHLKVLVQLHLAEVARDLRLEGTSWDRQALLAANSGIFKAIKEDNPVLALAVEFSREIAAALNRQGGGGWWSSPGKFVLTSDHEEAREFYGSQCGGEVDRAARGAWGGTAPIHTDPAKITELDDKLYAFLALALRKAGAPRGDFSRIVLSAARALGHESAPQLTYSLAMTLVQTLSQEAGDRMHRLARDQQHMWEAMKSEWRTTQWKESVSIEIAASRMGDVYVYYCTAENSGVDLASLIQVEAKTYNYRRGRDSEDYVARRTAGASGAASDTDPWSRGKGKGKGKGLI